MSDHSVRVLFLVVVLQSAAPAFPLVYVDEPFADAVAPAVADPVLVPVVAADPPLLPALHSPFPLSYPVFPYYPFAHHFFRPRSHHVRQIVHTYARETGQIRDTSIRSHPTLLRSPFYRHIIWDAKKAARKAALSKTLKQKKA